MNDPLMDIDRCEHPNATSNITIAPISIDYLQALCMMNLTYAYSQYQSLMFL